MTQTADAPIDPGRSEIVRFLAQRPPFDALAAEEISEIAAQAQIEFHLRGTVIVAEGGDPVTFLRVVHSGAVDIVHDGRLLDLLGPGDTFGHAAMLAGLPPGFAARAAEDTLCYRIPDTVARPLLDSARRRELAIGRGEAGIPVGRLIRTATVTCKPSENVGTVAQRMTAHGATAAIVVMESGELGIVTDRDLRSRVLARGRSGAVRIDSIMTTPVFTVAPDRTASEVVYEMLERGLHHVPVVTERGRLVGMLEHADLFAGQPRSWFGTRREIERARTLERLAEVADRVPALMVELHQSGAAVLELTRVLSALVDAVTARALELAAAQEPAPAGTVWVTVGSQARRELTFTAERRGGLVTDQPGGEGWASTAAAALRVAGVSAAPVCRDAGAWHQAALGGDPLALAVVADRRVLWGTPGRPLPYPEGEDHARLVEQLRRLAASASPPTGFEAGAVLRADGRRYDRLDVRAAAIAPIAALGRWAATCAGSDELTTPDRLAAAAQAGVMDADTAATLADAFTAALELQFSHQLRQLAAGQPPDDLLDPAAMSALTRDHLRAAFRAVATATRELR